MSSYKFLVPDVQTLNPQFQVPTTYSDSLYGYDMLSDIYKSIIGAVAGSTNYGNTIRISSNIDQQINTKLQNLMAAENELREAIKNTELKRRLQYASNGQIDPNRIPDEYLPGILQKHANLLGLTTNYNDQVRNIVNILMTLNDTLNQRTVAYQPTGYLGSMTVQIPQGAAGQSNQLYRSIY